MAVHKKYTKREAKPYEFATDFELLPTLSFVEFVARDSPPLDIDPADCTNLSVPPLVWSEFNKMPAEVCVTNTGHHLNVEARYAGQGPSLRGSVLRCPYEFWCFRFDWGFSEDGGSVHRIKGKRFPMEIHLMFYNVSYPNTDEALAAEDGILVLVYMCELTDEGNQTVKNITSKLKKIRKPRQSARVDPFALSSLFGGDLNDYIMYWSQSGNDDHSNPILWMISSEPVFINSSELSDIRSLRSGSNGGGSCRAAATDGPRPRSTSARARKVFAVTADRPRAPDSPRTGAEDRVRLAALDATADYAGPPSKAAAECGPAKIAAGGALSLASRKTTMRPDRPVPSDDLEDPRGPDARVAATFAAEIWTRVARDVPTASVETGKTEKIASVFEADTATRPIENAENVLTVLSDTETKDPVIETKDPFDDRKEPVKTHRDGVRMNSTTLRREQHIKNKLQKKL